MNRLIAFLLSEGNPSVARLKQVYRVLCKKTHPDVTGADAALFVKLRAEYEEALLQLEKGIPTELERSSAIDETPRKRAKPENPRAAVLTGIYRYALKFYSRVSSTLLDRLILDASYYRADLQTLLADYRDTWLSSFDDWRDDGKLFYSHNLFLACVTQLAYWYSFGLQRHRTLLLAYLSDLRKRLQILDGAYRDVLERLTDWLAEEAEGERLPVIGE